MKMIVVFQSGRIGADENIDDFEGMTEQEIQKVLEEKEAKANAQILTMVQSTVYSRAQLYNAFD